MPEQQDDILKSKGKKRNYSQQRNEDLSNYVFGKVQPQSIPLEEAVIGALMLDKDALTIVLDILRAESFYLEAHQLIYKAMLRLFEKSQPIDLLTVVEELKKSGDLELVGGPAYIATLTNRVASAANIEYHSRIIAQKYIQRELIRVSTNIIRDAYEDTTDVFQLLDDAEQGLFSIAQQNMSRGYDSMAALSNKLLKQIEELRLKEDGLTGVPTGFTELDRVTSGWQRSDLIIVAARPGMGKTAFTLSLAKNAAMDFQKPVALFSLEMSSIQLATRIISQDAEISGSKMRNGQLEDYELQQLQTSIERISEAPIYIDDTPGINIFELRAKCRRMKMQHDIQLIIIDYLQLMSGGKEGSKGGGNREQEISSISRALKGLAKELDVPIIALSQLSRAVEVRGGTKRPQLSDLRECISGDSRIYLPETCVETEVEKLVGQAGFKVIAMDEHGDLVEATCLDVWETGQKWVYEITTSNGQKVKASSNHPFFTPYGWKTLETLQKEDQIAVADDELMLLIRESDIASRPSLSTTITAISWARIVSIEPKGMEMTYDLHVEGHHNFLVNGIVAHNSGAIEQDADIVSFIYRPEYYDILEDEEGQSLKGIAEIIIAKHRNGALKTVKLKFTDTFARFSNLDEDDFGAFIPETNPNNPFANIITKSSRMNNDDEEIPF